MRRVGRVGWGKADGRQEHLCPENGASLATAVSQTGLSPGPCRSCHPREMYSGEHSLGWRCGGRKRGRREGGARL